MLRLTKPLGANSFGRCCAIDMAIDQPSPPINEIEADRCLVTNRSDIMATLAKADHRMLAGDYRAASAFYGAVGRLAEAGAAINRSELLRACDAALWLDQRFAAVLHEGLAAAGLSPDNRHPQFQKSLEIMMGQRRRDRVFTHFPQLPQSYFYPDLPQVDFADNAAGQWRAEVEQQADTILSEACSLLSEPANFLPYVQQTSARPQGDVHGLLDNPDWSTCYLTDRGQPIAERVARAPVTFQTLNTKVPLCRIGSRAPSIMFSLLRAHAQIAPHTGMINTRFVCHLPLIVPRGCGFRVGEETRAWRVGELMVFDDSVEHEAWNNSEQDRLVLIFDVWRPELSEQERAQITALFAVVDAY